MPKDPKEEKQIEPIVVSQELINKITKLMVDMNYFAEIGGQTVDILFKQNNK